LIYTITTGEIMYLYIRYQK